MLAVPVNALNVSAVKMKRSCVWRPILPHFWPRRTVRVPSLGTSDETPLNLLSQNHCLPPQHQWSSWKVHCELKASLMSKVTANWLEALPIALLGIHSTVKEDLHCTSAEMVYGTTLHLLGDSFQASTPTDMVEDLLSYVDSLKSTMQRLLAIPTRHHISWKSFVPPRLVIFRTCVHPVWHSQTLTTTTLRWPFSGPQAPPQALHPQG